MLDASDDNVDQSPYTAPPIIPIEEFHDATGDWFAESSREEDDDSYDPSLPALAPLPDRRPHIVSQSSDPALKSQRASFMMPHESSEAPLDIYGHRPIASPFLSLENDEGDYFGHQPSGPVDGDEQRVQDEDDVPLALQHARANFAEDDIPLAVRHSIKPTQSYLNDDLDDQPLGCIHPGAAQQQQQQFYYQQQQHFYAQQAQQQQQQQLQLQLMYASQQQQGGTVDKWRHGVS